MWNPISVNAYQAMVVMQPIAMLAVVFVEPVPIRELQGIPSALLVLLDPPFQVVRPRPQAQTLVFVEEMLR